MEPKKNDYFLNSITNPTFSPKDFYNMGIDASNTSFEDPKRYKDLQYIQQFPLFQKDGKFDEDLFNQYYLAAADGYQKLAQHNFADAVANQFAYYKDDILAPKELRIQGPEFKIVKEVNPKKQKISAWGLNSYSDPTQSEREIAESNLVYDGKTKSWQESPNDQGFFGNLSTTKVLAQWDFDADENGQPTTDPEKIVYRKGEHKLNYKNQPYYETLNGRSTYGREVLSAFDTITKDGSTANQFDFFDSDDIDKSFGGNLVKNVVKVAPVFIPQIAPWYIGTRIALELFDFGSKLLKMTPFVDSDNSTLSAIEGVSKSLTFSSSDYAKDHAWSLENLFNMGADVFTQLAEQRWIFESVPKYIRGNNAIFKSEEALQAYRTEQVGLLAEREATLSQKAAQLAENKSLQTSESALEESAKRLQNASSLVNQAIENQLKGNYKLGHQLGRIYMTGVTIADAYEEAKEAGMDDTSAAIFMLTYGAMEYGILSTGFGEWFFPELRMEKARYRRMLSTLYRDGQQKIGPKPPIEAETSEKVKWYKNMMNHFTKFFKNFENGEYGISKDGTAKILAQHLFANATGEGVEEVAEEAIRDIAKVLSNEATFIGGGTHLKPTWENENGEFDLSLTLSDYALNFVGGAIGGGIGQLHPNFREATRIKQLNDKNSAFQELVYHLRNGQGDKIRSIIKKFTFEDPHLSTTLNSSGVYSSGTQTNNQNLAAQNQFLKYIDKLEQALNVVGARDGQGILSDLALKDLRFASLLKSNVAASYLQQYHSLISRNVSLIVEKQEILAKGKTSDSAKLSEADEDRIKLIDTEIAENQKKIERFHNGEEGKEFVLDALFELNDGLSSGYLPTNILQYIQLKEFNNGKQRDLKDIPKEELDEYKQQWVALKESDLKDNIRDRRKWFDINNKKVSKLIADFVQEFLQNKEHDLSTLFENKMLDIDQGRFTQIINSQNNPLQLYKNLFTNTGEKSSLSRDSILTKLLTSVLHDSDQFVAKIDDALSLLENPNELMNDPTKIKSINEILQDPSLETIIPNAIAYNNGNSDINKFQNQQFLNTLYTLISNDIKHHIFAVHQNELLSDIFGNAKYIHPSVKQSIIDYIQYDQFINKAFKNTLIEKINQVKNTPMVDFLDSFGISLNDSNLKISDLITILEKQLKKGVMSHSLSEFGIDADTQEAINVALSIIKLAQNHLAAARNDAASALDLFGYNATSNELLKTNLSTIDTQTYNALNEDLIKVATELKIYKKLIDINSGEILTEQDKIKTKLLYDRYKFIQHKFSAGHLDDWEGKNEFEKTLKEIEEILTDFNVEPSKYPTLTEELMGKITKADAMLARAIYKLFNNPKNRDKNITQILTSQEFEKFMTINDMPLDASVTTVESAKNLLTYIAAAATLDYGEFLKAYIQTLDSKFVPLTGQMEMLFVQCAFMKNRFWFDKFALAYNEKIDQIKQENLKKEIDQETFDLHPEVLYKTSKESSWDDMIHIQFENTFLVEGGPGTGKSSANNALLLNLLQILNGDQVQQPIFVVGKTTSKVNELIDLYSKQTGLSPDQFVGFTHEEYLSYINDDYTSKKADNYVLLSQEDVKQGQHEIYHYSYEQNLNTNKQTPGIIIIDEVTQLTQQDLLLHTAYCSKTNSRSIATGDFHQSTLKGRIDGLNIVLNTYRNNFVTFGIYTQSMRSTNFINTYDINEVQRQSTELIKTILDNIDIDNPTDLPVDLRYDRIKYVENESGLYGIKNLVLDDTVTQDIKDSINLMLETLQEKQKIVYIYSDDQSVLYKYLNDLNSSGEYRDKIVFRKGSALGEEGQYYILEQPHINQYLDQVTSDDFTPLISIFEDLYTSISRAEQGTLVITNPEDSLIIENEKVETPGIIEISERDRLERINTIKTRFQTVLQQMQDSEPAATQKSGAKTEPTQSQSSEEKPIATTETPTTSDDSVTDEEIMAQADEVPYYINETEGKTIAPLYSFNTFSLGVEIRGHDSNGFKISQKDAKRLEDALNDADEDYKPNIEGVFGIQKLIGKSIVQKHGENYYIADDIVDGLKALRYYIKHIKTFNPTDQNDSIYKAIEDIKSYLEALYVPEENIEGIKIKFVFKAYPPDGGHSPRMQKEDHIIGFQGSSSEAAKTQRNKGIYGIITDKNGNELFETQIYAFPNILSLLDSLHIKDEWENFVANYNDRIEATSQLQQFKGVLADKLRELKNKKAEELTHIERYMRTNYWAAIRLIDIFTAAEEYYIELDTKLITALDLTGPIMPKYDEKGVKYEFSQEYEWNKELKPLKDLLSPTSQFYSMNKIYIPNIDVTNNDGELIIRAGASFILISENPASKNWSDKDWIQNYIKQEKTRKDGEFQDIKMLLITAPTGTIAEYLDNLQKTLQPKRNNTAKDTQQMLDANSEEDPDNNHMGEQDEKNDNYLVFFGNRTTNLRMLYILLNSETFMQQLQNYWDQSSFLSASKSVLQNRLEAIKSIVNVLEHLRQSNPRKLYEILGRGVQKSKTMGELNDLIEFKTIKGEYKTDNDKRPKRFIFPNSKLPVDKFISSNLWRLLFKAGSTFSDNPNANPYEDTTIKKIIIEELSKEKNFPKGVFYHIPLFRSELGQASASININNMEFIPLKVGSKTSNNPFAFEIADHKYVDLKCIDKVDTTIAHGDINPILNQFNIGYSQINKGSQDFTTLNEYETKMHNYIHKDQQKLPSKTVAYAQPKGRQLTKVFTQKSYVINALNKIIQATAAKDEEFIASQMAQIVNSDDLSVIKHLKSIIKSTDDQIRAVATLILFKKLQIDFNPETEIVYNNDIIFYTDNDGKKSMYNLNTGELTKEQSDNQEQLNQDDNDLTTLFKQLKREMFDDNIQLEKLMADELFKLRNELETSGQIQVNPARLESWQRLKERLKNQEAQQFIDKVIEAIKCK